MGILSSVTRPFSAFAHIGLGVRLGRGERGRGINNDVIMMYQLCTNNALFSDGVQSISKM